MKEYTETPEDKIIDIGLDNWEPHIFTEDKQAMRNVLLAGKEALDPNPEEPCPEIMCKTTATEETDDESKGDEDITFSLIDDPFEAFMDCQDSGEFMDSGETEEFFDAQEHLEVEESPPGRVMHLTIDYQTIGKWEKGRQVCHIASDQVSEFLDDFDYYQLV